MNESAVDAFIELVDKDVAAKTLFEQRWNKGKDGKEFVPASVLNAMFRDSSGVYDDKAIDYAVKELTAFNYEALQLKSTNSTEQEVYDKASNQQKEKLFFADLVKKMGHSPEEVEAYLKRNGELPKEIGLAKLMAMADVQSVGASRVMLSYIVNADSFAQRQKWNVENAGATKYTKSQQVPKEIETQIQLGLLEKYLPALAVADKESYSGIMMGYLKKQRPEYAKQFDDTKNNNLVRSALLLRMVAYDQ